GQVTIADINVYYSKGNEFYRVDDTWNTGGAGIGLLAQVESNGDGKTDIISQSTILSTANVTTLFFNKESLANLLAQVADGLGNVNMFGYEPLTTSTNYTKGTNAQYPLVDVKAPLYVAAYHQAPNGLGTHNITYYNYKEAVAHAGGRGFLGFKTVLSETPVLKTKTEVISNIDPTYYAPYVKEINT